MSYDTEILDAAVRESPKKAGKFSTLIGRNVARRRRAVEGVADEQSRRQRGIAVLDFILYTVLVIGAVGGVLAVFGTGKGSSNVNETLAEVGTIETVTQQLFPSSNYTGLTQNTLATSNALPTKYYSGNNLVSPFGNITVSATTGGTGFNIVVPAVSPTACVTMATEPLGTASETVYVVGANANANATGNLTAAAAATACAGGNASITYNFNN